MADEICIESQEVSCDGSRFAALMPDSGTYMIGTATYHAGGAIGRIIGKVSEPRTYHGRRVNIELSGVGGIVRLMKE
jgi:hypothetical protein